jgi:hypothetical protein
MMTQFKIFLPLFAQILVTFLVWCWLIWGRVSTLLLSKTNPQKTADEAQSRKIFKNYENQSDNLENLFELPVLFYVSILIVAFAGLTNSFYLYAAWTFVFTRAIHSVIHCTYNRVTHRFYAYVISSFILWLMWIRIAIQILEQMN